MVADSSLAIKAAAFDSLRSKVILEFASNSATSVASCDANRSAIMDESDASAAATAIASNFDFWSRNLVFDASLAKSAASLEAFCSVENLEFASTSASSVAS